MNNYIYIEMQSTREHGGILETNASFKLDNYETPFSNISVKIDTGCSISTIPLQTLNVKENICQKLKRNDLINDISNVRSFGVETGRNRPPAANNLNGKIADKAIKFKHGISPFYINGCKINCESIFINYDRTGNILIGMDILKDWDIHIGKSKATGKTTFIACPYAMLNNEYFKTLNKHFVRT